MKRRVYAYIFLTVLIACGGNSVKNEAKNVSKSGTKSTLNDVTVTDTPKLKVKAPKSVKQGEDVVIEYQPSGSIDSVVLYINNKIVGSPSVGGKWVILTNEDSRVGLINYKIEGFNTKGRSKSTTLGRYMVTPAKDALRYKAVAIANYPHEKLSYTQGLEFRGDRLIESSGEYGKSFIQIQEFPSMRIIKRVNLASHLFAEGITVVGDKLYQLTWREGICLIYDANTLEKIGEKHYSSEGWGLTTDGKLLYMTDGSQYIYILDAQTFKQVDRLEVLNGENTETNLNELEWINGEIWANIYTEDRIVRINPKSGAVVGVVDASGLLKGNEYDSSTDVLNGIAYNPKDKSIYLTGKNWPKLFKVRIDKID